MSIRERRNPIRILLVEEDPDAIRTIWNMLHEKSRYKFHVEAVTRMPEALNRLKNDDIDAVLLDLLLATHQFEMDAVAAVKAANSRVAVVVLTTLEDEEAGLTALERGADDYLLKEEIGTRALVRSLHYAVERKRFEAALAASEAKYRTLADLSPDAIVISVDGKYIYANPAAVALVGADDETQIVGCASFELDPNEAAEVRRHPRSVEELTRPRPEAREVLWRRFDDSSVDVEVVAAPIHWGDQEALLELGRDITIRTALEEEREALLEREQIARQEAERAVGIQRLFLGMVSHELRTPLASIKGFSSSILADDVTFGPEELQEFVGIIDMEADRLNALISQLMDVVQVQAGVLRVEPRAAPIREIVASVMPQLALITANHELRVDLPPDLPEVLADPGRIGQVLVNLVGNAVKFSPPQTPVTISALQVNGSVQVSVADEGAGIEAAERDLVFEVFYQASVQGGRKPGSGLGLAICKGLVEAHGGRIWIDEPAETGTTIHFTLPIATTSVEN